MVDVSLPHPPGERGRGLPRRLDDAPERLLVEVVVRDVAGQRLASSARTRPRGVRVAGERPVEAAQRLEPDEVAQDEHVERDLEPQLPLDLASPSARSCPTCSPARCRARRTGRRRSGRSSRRASARRRARGRAAARAPRDRCRTRPRTGAGRATSRTRTPPRRPPRGRARATGRARARCISVSSIRTPPSASSRHCRISRFASSTLLGSSFSTPSSAGHAREEAVQRRVRDRAALHRVGLGVDRPRGEEALDEPGGRAVGETLELGHGEGGARPELLEHERVREPRRPLERAERALEPPLPAVRASERLAPLRVAGRELGQRPQPLSLGRRLLERPRQRRERPPAGPAPHVLDVEERRTSCQNGLASRGLPSSSAASRTR